MSKDELSSPNPNLQSASPWDPLPKIPSCILKVVEALTADPDLDWPPVLIATTI